jgi:hypothetical protein
MGSEWEKGEKTLHATHAACMQAQAPCSHSNKAWGAQLHSLHMFSMGKV